MTCNWKCINFGGCYGYDLEEVFFEFVHRTYVVTVDCNQAYPIDSLAEAYISYIEKHYDPSITYQKDANRKLVLRLIKTYNKSFTTKHIILHSNMVSNLRVKYTKKKTDNTWT